MDEAIQYVCASNFHRRLWLSQTSTHERLRVTYSTTSNFSNDALPAVLFCGPMFGSRWNSILMDHVAATTGVRVICVDRPGMGGSTPVPLNIRIDVWLETVPALLGALNVQHISLLSHSAGTTYALNTLTRLRDVLDPKRPYLALIAPWVHNAHSNAMLMNLASKVPDSLFSSWDQLARFINTRVAPAVSMSGGLISSAVNLFQAEPGSSDTGDLSPGERYGVSEDVGTYIDKLQLKWVFAESMTAANDDALLCLKKAGSSLGACDDYEEYVRQLAKQEQQRLTDGVGASKLKIDVFFAESDVMIGKGGQHYFEQCWKQDGVADAVSLSSTVLPGTDHDSAILDLRKGALKIAFEVIAGQTQ